MGNSAESAQGVEQSSSAEGPGRGRSKRITPLDLGGIAGRMEVIQPKDVSLVKYLGSGGYGEVYLGKWHSSEAAIKCLNPSLFFNEGQVSASLVASSSSGGALPPRSAQSFFFRSSQDDTWPEL